MNVKHLKKRQDICEKLTPDDMAMLHLITDDYGSDMIREYIINEARGGGGGGGIINPNDSTSGQGSSRTTNMSGVITNKEGKSIHSKEGQWSLASAGFYRGLFSVLPSIAVSCATYGFAGTAIKMLGVLHYRNEYKWLHYWKAKFNPDSWSDWATTFNGKEDPKRARMAKAEPVDSSTGKKEEPKKEPEKKPEEKPEEKPDEKKEVEKVKKDREEIVKKNKVFYAEYSTHELQKIYAYDMKEARAQANTLIYYNNYKYDDMNKLYKKGAHTYRIIFEDGSITYMTASSQKQAVDISQKFQISLFKLYQSFHIKDARPSKVKSISDEGVINIPIPTVVAIHETAPSPERMPKLHETPSTEKYTTDKVRTYKLRLNTNIINIAADDEKCAVKVGIDIAKSFRGSYLSFNTLTVDSNAIQFRMDDGDIYTIPVVAKPQKDSTAIPGMDKLEKLIKAKYDAIRKFGGPNASAMITDASHKTTSKIGDTLKVNIDEKKKMEIPEEFNNLRLLYISRIKDGKEAERVYTFDYAKRMEDAVDKELTSGMGKIDVKSALEPKKYDPASDPDRKKKSDEEPDLYGA